MFGDKVNGRPWLNTNFMPFNVFLEQKFVFIIIFVIRYGVCVLKKDKSSKSHGKDGA